MNGDPILVVDDDDQFRSMLRELLSRAGYPVLEALALALRCGADRTLAKPFSTRLMLDTIRDLLAPGSPGVRRPHPWR